MTSDQFHGSSGNRLKVPDGCCDRTAVCLNFRRVAVTFCARCGEKLAGNHFHSGLRRFRLCEACFVTELAKVFRGTYSPRDRLEDEEDICARLRECFQRRPYSLYVAKTCDRCGRYPPEHFHDVNRNIRLCLSCYEDLYPGVGAS